MKRIICVIVFLATMLLALFAQNVELPRLAVVEFEVNSQRQKVKEDAIAIRNIVRTNIVASNKYSVITRDEIDKLMINQDIQADKISSPENRKKLQLINISYIITGTVDAIDNDYNVTISLLDVSNGHVSNQTSQKMSSTSTDIITKTAVLANNFQRGLSNVSGKVTQAGSTRTYNIGDFGPAGGYVFYDKGVFSNGWRYLEAAPAETEFTAEWGAYGTYVNGTNTGVGFGKRNTELIIERLKTLGEAGKAAQVCAGLNFDGYNDWFLPSLDELELMYMNLRQKGLGRFMIVEPITDFYGDKSDLIYIYLSSSQNDLNSAFGHGFGDRKPTRKGRSDWEILMDQIYQKLLIGGRKGYIEKNKTFSVRAVRAF